MYKYIYKYTTDNFILLPSYNIVTLIILIVSTKSKSRCGIINSITKMSSERNLDSHADSTASSSVDWLEGTYDNLFN